MDKGREIVLETLLQSRQTDKSWFSTLPAANLISSSETRRKVAELFNYACGEKLRFSGKGKGDDRDGSGMLDIAYHGGVGKALEEAILYYCAHQAQGRISKGNSLSG